MHRHDYKPLSEGSAIYEVLSKLDVGDTVPPQIYIRDFRRGGIPAWIVREKSVSGPVTDLVVCDEGLPHKTIAMVVLTCQRTTLGGRLFQYFPGCDQARQMFGDIRQDARQIAEKMRDGLPPNVVAHNYRKEQRKLEKWNRGEDTRESPLVPVPLPLDGLFREEYSHESTI
jgi:hypothetical protein